MKELQDAGASSGRGTMAPAGQASRAGGVEGPPLAGPTGAARIPRGAVLGIMQPYFLPYLGYFQMIHAVDFWIVFDEVQYERHGWMNRNRVLHPDETRGWQYVMLPLQGVHRETRIRDVTVADPRAARARIIAQLGHLRRRAPFFDQAIAVLDEALDTDERSLSRLNVRLLAACCRRLGLPFEHAFSSDLGLRLGPIEGPGDWAPEICGALGARRYVNAPGGRALFDPRRFARHGVELTFLEPRLPPYPQGGRPFVPGLSILDVLLWNDAEQVRSMLASYTLTGPTENDGLAPPLD